MKNTLRKKPNTDNDIFCTTTHLSTRLESVVTRHDLVFALSSIKAVIVEWETMGFKVVNPNDYKLGVNKINTAYTDALNGIMTQFEVKHAVSMTNSFLWLIEDSIVSPNVNTISLTDSAYTDMETWIKAI